MKHLETQHIVRALNGSGNGGPHSADSGVPNADPAEYRAAIVARLRNGEVPMSKAQRFALRQVVGIALQAMCKCNRDYDEGYLKHAAWCEVHNYRNWFIAIGQMLGES